MNANIAAAKGIEPCPLCESDDVRWRRRRPTDFVLTWARYLIEWFWSAVVGHGRVRNRRRYMAETGVIDAATMHDLPEVKAEIAEANTGHRTPKRYWRCNACHREGHVF